MGRLTTCQAAVQKEVITMRQYEGNLLGEGMKIGIVVSRFNEFITTKLLSGALDVLRRHGVRDEDVEVAWVPGAFEVPLVALRMASSKRYDSVICLAAVIRGSTPHFDYICAEVTKGIAQVALSTGVPTIFGVITADDLEQAIERAGVKMGNKGGEAARAAIEMANLMRTMKGISTNL